ncbi:peptidoglycan-binding domain-containing protein [Streptomyces sp. NPDC002044]|uniref:peptidoglycan-binding domain-containing protein n=1 Tax=Streptomyces sp. NPDC002044 TaxID=3154662 RepID=UPI0033227E4A
MRLQAVVPGDPAAPGGATGGGTAGGGAGFGFGVGAGGGGGGPEKRTGTASRRLLPLLLGAAAVVALGGTAMALWTMPDSSGDEVTLLDAKPSAPVVSVAPPVPSPTPSAGASAPSPSASRSPSPSASRSASPSPSPSPSRSASPSASPSPSPSASRSPSPKPSAPAPGPTLRFGDSGADVEKLQRLLADQGLYRGKINGRFDSRVEWAVSTFQFENGIDDEEWGVYGPVTRRALEG